MDFAPTATPRVQVTYVSCGIVHKIECRRPRGEAPATSITNAYATIGDCVGALVALLPTDFAFTDAVYIAQDSDVATPAGAPPISPTGVQDPADYTGVMKITATTFSGKSSNSKTRLSVFGVFWNPSTVGGPAANGRVDAAEDAGVALAITNLNTVAPTYAIDGTIATFHPYATIKPNDKLLKLVRRGLIS